MFIKNMWREAPLLVDTLKSTYHLDSFVLNTSSSICVKRKITKSNQKSKAFTSNMNTVQTRYYSLH